VTIGEFATMTRLSRKALRHYHDLGLLEPAAIDPGNGYRYYDADQVPTARVIRRLRDLDLPVPELKSYLAADAADDEATRTAIVSAHLDRMRAQLRQIEAAVTALQALLVPAFTAARIEIRDEPAERAIAISDTVELSELITWWTDAGRELADALRVAGIEANGPLGALFAHELFADEAGLATVWLPVNAPIAPTGRTRLTEIPGGLFAVALPAVPDDRTGDVYAELGRYVAGRGIGAGGPVRERYLAGALDDPAPLLTEIAWPVSGR
jgi:DNA-binding transcriptional MerR regulator